MLSQYRCMVNGHDEQQIIGICENINCQQPYRRVCFDCQETHQAYDQQFKMADIKNEKGIQKLLDEFRQNNINKIKNIYAQCYIQQYFLTLKMIEYVEQYILKYSQLINILDDLDKFVKKEWKLVSITYYIQAEKNIGIYKYLQQIQDKLQIIDQSKDNYIMNINNRIINQNLQHQTYGKQGEALAQSIPLLIKENDITQQLIIKNDLCKNKQINKNFQQSIKDLVDKQGQILNTNILKEQYNQIEYLLSIDGIQGNEQQSILSQSRVVENKMHPQDNKQKSVQFFNEVNSLYNQQRYQEAIAYLYEGNSLYSQQRYQEAIYMYEQAMKLDHQCVLAYHNKGSSLHSLQRYQEAIDMFDQAIKLDPKYVLAYLYKGSSLGNQQRFYQAIEMYDQAIKLDPKFVLAYFYKGNSLYYQQRYQEAIYMYEQAMKLDHQCVLAYYNKGLSLYSLQRFKEAIDMYDQAIKLDPKYVDAYNYKGHSLLKMGKKQEAQKTFKECLKIDPNNQYAKSSLGLYFYNTNRQIVILSG